MKDMIQEFKAFINKGDVVMIAVGLVMALTFKSIIDAVQTGVLDPIIAAIAGESSISSIGFDIGDARISIGLVFQAIIEFLVVAVLLFVVVKAYNAWRSGDDDADEGPTEVELLAEIRDALTRR